MINPIDDSNRFSIDLEGVFNIPAQLIRTPISDHLCESEEGFCQSILDFSRTIWHWIKEHLLWFCFREEDQDEADIDSIASTLVSPSDSTEADDLGIRDLIGTVNQYNFVVRSHQDHPALGASACPFIASAACLSYLNGTLDYPINSSIFIDMVVLEGICALVEHYHILPIPYPILVLPFENPIGINNTFTLIRNRYTQGIRELETRDMPRLDQQLEEAAQHQGWPDISETIEDLFHLQADFENIQQVNLAQEGVVQSYFNALTQLAVSSNDEKIAALFTNPPKIFAIFLKKDGNGNVTYAGLFDSHGNNPSYPEQNGAYLTSFSGTNPLQQIAESLARIAPYEALLPDNNFELAPLKYHI